MDSTVRSDKNMKQGKTKIDSASLIIHSAMDTNNGDREGEKDRKKYFTGLIMEMMSNCIMCVHTFFETIV